MRIILLGAGKAGYLHLNSYLKMIDSQTLPDVEFLFVDPGMTPGKDLLKLCEEKKQRLKIWPTLEALIHDNHIYDRENDIIDLCLPSAILFDEFCHALKLGFKKIIIEKPILIREGINSEIVSLIKNADVFMVRNYLYSFVQYKIKELLQEFEILPEMLLTNFSKNRVQESFSGRAFTREHAPTAFEIEIPHQLYIADDIFGQSGRTIYSMAEDMVKNDECINSHGLGVVIDYFGKNKVAIHYSNLQHSEITRTLDIFCSNDYTIHSIYSPICEELNDIKASVVLLRGNRIVKKYLCIERDDNMYNMFSFAIDALINHRKDRLSTINDLIYTSERLLNIIDKSRKQEDRLQEEIHNIDLNLVYKLMINNYVLNGDAKNAMNNFIEQVNINKFNEILPSMFAKSNSESTNNGVA
ncbi:Uncharacterised protein [Pragia fontium]|nr:Uncharacterised protein [Pragia fontium]